MTLSCLLKMEPLLVIGGTTDFGASRFNMPSPDLQRTFEGTPAEAVRILMAHQPKTTYRSKMKDLSFNCQVILMAAIFSLCIR